MEKELIIRDARAEDAERLLEIYAYYVLNTAVSFEYAVPSVEEFGERMRRTQGKYPYLVCEKQHTVIGYAYAGPTASEKPIPGLRRRRSMWTGSITDRGWVLCYMRCWKTGCANRAS